MLFFSKFLSFGFFCGMNAGVQYGLCFLICSLVLYVLSLGAKTDSVAVNRWIWRLRI